MWAFSLQSSCCLLSEASVHHSLRIIMSTQYSMDAIVTDVVFTAIFMEDGFVVTVEDFETHGRVYVGGDIIYLERDDREQLVVVLGVGGTQEEAEEAARVYVRRLAKWHGQDNDEGNSNEELIVFGHDLAQSQLFDVSNNNAEESEADSESESAN